MSSDDLTHHKYLARKAVATAQITGKLIRPNHCVNCENPCIPQAHHPDYDKPLAVLWLCIPCHNAFHHPFVSHTNKHASLVNIAAKISKELLDLH